MFILYIILAAFVLSVVIYQLRAVFERKRLIKEAEAQRLQEEENRRLEEKAKREAEIMKVRDAEEEKKRIESEPLTVIGIDGVPKDIWRRKAYPGDIVLIADEGHTYHTHADCFEKWEDVYFENFTGWKEVELKEVRKKGYRLCKYCEHYFDFLEEQ